MTKKKSVSREMFSYVQRRKASFNEQTTINPPSPVRMQGNKRHIVLLQQGFYLVCGRGGFGQSVRQRTTAASKTPVGCIRPSSYYDRCNLSSRETPLLRVPVPFSAARVARFPFSFPTLFKDKTFHARMFSSVIALAVSKSSAQAVA